MPSFDCLILSAPSGFSRGCALLNDMVVSNVDGEEGGASSIVATLLKKLLLQPNYAPNPALLSQYKEEFAALKFLVRSYFAANPKPTVKLMATALDSSTLLERGVIELLVSIIDSVNTSSEAEAAHATVPSSSSSSIGKLSNFQWRAGVAITSNQCSKLTSPYVSISFDVKKSDGSKTFHTLELSYDEFQVSLSQSLSILS